MDVLRTPDSRFENLEGYPFVANYIDVTASDTPPLRMHFLDAMSIDEMGQVFHVHRATIARWLVAIRREVLEQICRKISLNLRASSSEFRSIVRLVRGDVRLSLHRILGEDPRE